MDKDVVLNALESAFNDFEDALQNFSAVKHGDIHSIITRNIKDYKHSTLNVITPDVFLKSGPSLHGSV